MCVEQSRTILAAGHGVRPGFGKNRWFWALLFTFDFHVTNFEWSLYWPLCPAVCSSSHQGAVRRRAWHANLTLEYCPVARTCSPLSLALYWMEAVSVGILPSSVQLRELPKLEFCTRGTWGRKMLALASWSLGTASLNGRALPWKKLLRCEW